MALAAVRRIRQADQRVRAGEWGFAPLRPLHLPSAMTVGVIGTGRIGRHAARQFVGLGFRVLAYDIVKPTDVMPSVQFVESLTDLVQESDILSLPVPGSPDGSPLFSEELLAALDVFPKEPPNLDVFAGVSEHMLFTPHMAWYTEESEADLRFKAAHEVRRLLLGERPKEIVVEANFEKARQTL